MVFNRDVGLLFVDARGSDVFNGWNDGSLPRGGHVPGSVNFDVHWLNVVRDDLDVELDEALQVKGMTPQRHLVLCDAGGDEARRLAQWLEQKGFADFEFLDLRDWLVDSKNQLEQYPGYGLVMPAFALKNLLDGKSVETFENASSLKVIEVSKGGPQAYCDRGHIAGTAHLDVDWLYRHRNSQAETEYHFASPEELEEVLLTMGLTAGDTVVVTGQSPMASCRAAWALYYAGVADVRVLNGGLDAWRRQGYELSTEAVTPKRAEKFGSVVPRRPETLKTIEDIQVLIEDWKNTQLVDIRSKDEYCGDAAGYDHEEVLGHIPGAKLAHAGKGDPHSLEYYRNVDQTMKEGRDILNLWKDCGIDVERHLIFACGMGWRASEVWLYARVMGLSDLSVYSDGWIRWSRGGYPVGTGLK